MAGLKKTMCKTAKDGLKANEEAVMNEVSGAKYICKNCLRTATDKKLLCEPKKIKIKDEKAAML